MSVIRLALYGTLGNVRYSTSLIRDTWECMSHVCPYTPGLRRDTLLMFSQVMWYIIMNVTRNNNPSVIVVYFVYTASVTVEYSQSRPLSDVLYYHKEKNRQAKNGGAEGGGW